MTIRDEEKTPTRKPYRRPKLVEHGHIRDLTRTASTNSKDGGPNSKTSRT